MPVDAPVTSAVPRFLRVTICHNLLSFRRLPVWEIPYAPNVWHKCHIYIVLCHTMPDAYQGYPLFRTFTMQRVAYLLVPEFQVMLFAGITVFEVANKVLPQPHYDIRLISEHGGAVQCSLGYSVMTDSFAGASFDTVIIGGAIEINPASPAVIGYLN